ncbi:DUF885 domain-containing protein [Lentzea nigeriaca]|uniref:DUF885 domain-containing protein n=1 Tax=Lentzea nigeriaca TaxID=1128665 RepID=UPI00195CA61A|nr:DUF885 domain-containing protein [Lentzea nigeriaca]MBM7857930.1 uncharacterized protein (DUF885 family) [Lentzea nigeriaca]
MRDLADRLFDLTLDHHTLRPNLMGLRDDGELQDHSEEADQVYLRRYRSIADEAERRTPETEDDRITRDLVLHLTRAECDTIESRAIEYGVSGYLQTAVPELLYFLGHLKSHHAVPRFLATVAERHRAGVEAGRTPVRLLVEQAIALVDQYDDPAVRHYRDVLVNDVLPYGRDEEHAGLCWLPDGESSYRKAIRTHTTLDLDPHELHTTGLRLIEDIKREFGGRRPSSLKYTGADEMIEDAETAVRRAESIAPQWFRTAPRARCEIAASAPSVPASAPPHYLPAALDGSRPGTYFVNTKDPHTRLRAIAEATAFHEAVPGHHFESARLEQLGHLPLLRRKARITAFTEGWALYSERLADEMGLYSTEEARLGMLTMDAKRAGRLVADTGLHAKGWSRPQAIDYLLANTPMPRELAEAEVDRYLAQPGQALAYMVGRLKFQELRGRAEQALGTAFDVRDFHEVVLGRGKLTLGLLDDVVTAWIAER